MHIRVETPNPQRDEPKWRECGMTSKDRVTRKPQIRPEQLPLFKAIEELKDRDMEITVLRKEPGRVQLGIDIVFKNRIA